MDAAVILNIFQEMEEVVAMHFETFARQMPFLLEEMKHADNLPDTAFTREETESIEANPMHFPKDFINMFAIEMKRRKLHASEEMLKQERSNDDADMELL